MNIDATISYELKASIFEMFEEKLGVSVTTGYNWSKAGSEVYNSQVEIDVKSTVKPGEVLQIQQAVGRVNNSIFSGLDFYYANVLKHKTDLAWAGFE